MLNVMEAAETRNGSADPTHKELRQAHSLIDFRIRRGAARQFAETMTITPAIASVLLARNPADENRNINARRVNAYVDDMVNGLWDGMNGQTIVVSDDGFLNDGQHRLNAIIAAGATIPMMVVFGAARESRLTLDQNRVRTPGDYLAMSGMPNSNNIAAAAFILYAYEHSPHHDGKWTKTISATKRAIHAYIMGNQDLLEWAVGICDKKSARKVTSVSRMAAAAAIIRVASGAPKADIEAFFDRLISGDGLGKTNPIFVARERLIAERISRVVRETRVMEIIVRAWNTHRAGKPMRRLALTDTLPAVRR